MRYISYIVSDNKSYIPHFAHVSTHLCISYKQRGYSFFQNMTTIIKTKLHVSHTECIEIRVDKMY